MAEKAAINARLLITIEPSAPEGGTLLHRRLVLRNKWPWLVKLSRRQYLKLSGTQPLFRFDLQLRPKYSKVRPPESLSALRAVPSTADSVLFIGRHFLAYRNLWSGRKGLAAQGRSFRAANCNGHHFYLLTMPQCLPPLWAKLISAALYN